MNITDHDFPTKTLQEWQSIVNLVARMAGVRAGLIMRLLDDEIEVFVSSPTLSNPFHVGERHRLLNSGLYCEAVINRQERLLIPNALQSNEWRNNPDIENGLVSYLGYPIFLPNGKPFGTICLLDDKTNEYSPDMIDLIEKMRDLIESQLGLMEENRLQRLFANESPLRKILDNIPTAIGCNTLGPNPRNIYNNAQFQQLFGYTLDDIPTGEDWFIQAYPNEQYRATVFQSWQTTVEQLQKEQGRPEAKEYRITCKDGRILDVLIDARILDDILLVSFIDVTERKLVEQMVRSTNERLEAMLNALPDLMFRVDKTGTILECHATDINQFYTSPMSFLGKKFTDVLPESATQVIITALDEAHIYGSHRGAIYTLPLPPGEAYFELSIAAMDKATGSDQQFIALVRDITERKQLENNLRESEQRHRLLADNASDVIITFDVEGRITYASPSVEKLRGYTSAEVMQQTLEDMLTPDGAASIRADLAANAVAIQAGNPVFDHRGDYQQICKDGSLVWTEVTTTCMFNTNGEFIGTLLVARDITERKHYEHEIELAHDALTAANQALQEVNAQLGLLATIDPLTGIWNRRHIQDFLEGEMAQAHRYGKHLSVLLIDIDHFKSINDQYGHHVGDQVLVELSQRLRSNLRMSDQVARWGGDEFVVVAPYCRANDALMLAEKLRRIVEKQSFPVAGTVTMSIGISELQIDETMDGWFKRADGALYEAKSNGRNMVRLAE